MKKGFALGVLIISLLMAGVACATVLTFDDLPDASGYTAPIGTYGGFTWGGMYYLETNEYPVSTSGYTLGTISGNNVAYNGFGAPVTISSDNGSFDFTGAYLTAAWSDNLSVTLTGYAGGVQKYSENVVLSNSQPTSFNFDWLGIDTLKMSGSGGSNPYLTHFALDDFTFAATAQTLQGDPTGLDPTGLGQVAPVPEPGTLVLLALGLGMLGLAGRSLRLG
jgi:hypothetical protein